MSSMILTAHPMPPKAALKVLFLGIFSRAAALSQSIWHFTPPPNMYQTR
jgi:hypothetical protein